MYLLIRQHYLAQFLPLQESDITDATLTLGGQRFRARGKVNVVTGWRGLFSGKQQKLLKAKMNRRRKWRCRRLNGESTAGLAVQN